jgi:hypothetical protein
METYPWSNPKEIEKLSREPVGYDLAIAIAQRLYNGRRVLNNHRDYCGHGLDFLDGKYRLLDVQDGTIELSKVLYEWKDEEEFVSFLSRQSDYTFSGAKKEEKLFFTDNLRLLNNQRLTKQALQKVVSFEYEKRYIDFFEHIVSPLPSDKRELLKNKLLHKDNDIEYAILDVLCEDGVMMVLNHRCDNIDIQIERLLESHGIEEYNEDYKGIQEFVDWIDSKGYEAIYWIVEMYDFRIIIKPKGMSKDLFDSAKECDFLLLPILPSYAYPSNFISLKNSSQDNLEVLLKKYAKEAKEMGKSLFLYFSTNECRPCAVLQNSLNSPKMLDAFKDVMILHLDYFEWFIETKRVLLDITSTPTFVYINEEAEVTDHIVDGDLWGDEDKPELMAKALKKFFIDKNSNPIDITDEIVDSAINNLIYFADFEGARYLVEKFDRKDLSKFLHTAISSCENGDLKIIKYLLQNGADINIRNEDGETPLLFAMKIESKAVTKYLLEKGADIEIRDSNGDTPLISLIDSFCFFDNFVELLSLFISYGANTQAVNAKMETPLQIVEKYKDDIASYDEVVALLREER